MMPIPDATPEQRERLARLIYDNPPALSTTQGRKVIMVAALLDGEDGKPWIAWLGAKPARVCNLKKELSEKGLGAFLDKWEGAVEKAKKHPKLPAGTPGPEGINTADEWLEKRNADSEPVFELVRMLIRPGANIAIFAARDRKLASSATSSGLQTFQGKIRQALAEPILKDLHWTKLSVFDAFVPALLAKLNIKHHVLQWRLNMAGELDEFEPILDPIPALRTDFGPDYEFFIVAQGDAGMHRVKRWCANAEADGAGLNPLNVLLIPTAAEFFDRLASTIYRLRERWSCPGLLPLHWLLYQRVMEWEASGDFTPFYYSCGAVRIARSLQHDALLWRYTALFGALFHMNRTMWSALMWKDEISLGHERIHPRISIDTPPQSGAKRLYVRMLPEIAYEFGAAPGTPDPTHPEAMTRHLRDWLRQRNTTAKFFYSTKPMDFSGWERAGNRGRSGKARETFARIHAVLLPRHFLARPEVLPLPLPELSALADGLTEGVCRRTLKVDGEAKPCLVLHAPSLIASIRRAYEANTYGDRIFDLQRHLRTAAVHLGRTDGHLPLKRMAVARLNFNRPSYWCLNPASDTPDSPDQFRWSALRAMQENAQENGSSFNFLPLPDDSVEQGFKDLLHDCDADFLLCHLSPKDRKKAGQLAEKWAARVNAFIKTSYDVDTPDGKGRVIAAVEEDFRSQAASRKNELKGWVCEILGVFSQSCLRVTRDAIEVAQRCSLAGLETVALVIESETSIEKRWMRFLRMTLKSKFIPPPGPGKKAGKLAPDEYRDDTDKPDHEASDGQAYKQWSQAQRSDDADAPEIKDLVALILALVQEPRVIILAQSFATEAAEPGSKVWSGVLQKLSERADGGQIEAAVLEALQICRSDASEDSKLQKIMSRFQKITGAKSKPDSRQERPSVGG